MSPTFSAEPTKVEEAIITHMEDGGTICDLLKIISNIIVTPIAESLEEYMATGGIQPATTDAADIYELDAYRNTATRLNEIIEMLEPVEGPPA